MRKKFSFALSIGVFLLLVFLLWGQMAPTEEWVARYKGPGNTKDFVNDIATDSLGRVYVTGYSEGTGPISSYTTVAYDSDGNQIWDAQYSDPGNNSNYATAIAIGLSGNVYVTGGSAVSSTDSDYATVAYDSFGNQLWVRRYDGIGANMWDVGGAIATDSLGRVYVTGASEYYDFPWEMMAIATVAYESDGTLLWDARYGGSAYHFDAGAAIATDSSGNVYVTGYSYNAGTNSDYTTLAYNGSTGALLWVATYNGPENDRDKATDIAIDSQGNVYVTGQSGGYFSSDYVTVVYDNSGTELWVGRYNGPGDGQDAPNAIAVDSQGNVYVTGASEGSGTSSDIATVAYNSTGTQLWEHRYNGPGNDRDEGRAIATDSAGNVYVTGFSTGTEFSNDCVTLAYDSDGNLLGIGLLEGLEGWYEGGDAIALDSAGNVYVTGQCWFFDSSNNDLVTIKYSFCNTPPGDDVVAIPEDPDSGEAPVTLTFDEVTVGGETSLTISDTGPPPTTGFKLGNPPLFYEIETTAEYSGPIDICIDYTGISFDGPEENLMLSHQELNGDWIDITTSVDTENNIICGSIYSLSTFAVFESMTLEDLIQMVQASSIDMGVRTSLVQKLQNSQKSLEKGNINAAINQIMAFQNEVHAQSSKKIPGNLADEWVEISEVIMASL